MEGKWRKLTFCGTRCEREDERDEIAVTTTQLIICKPPNPEDARLIRVHEDMDVEALTTELLEHLKYTDIPIDPGLLKYGVFRALRNERGVHVWLLDSLSHEELIETEILMHNIEMMGRRAAIDDDPEDEEGFVRELDFSEIGEGGN